MDCGSKYKRETIKFPEENRPRGRQRFLTPVIKIQRP